MTNSIHLVWFGLVWFIFFAAYQLIMEYLMPKLDLVNFAFISFLFFFFFFSLTAYQLLMDYLMSKFG